MASVITARLLSRSSINFLKFNNKLLPICSSIHTCCSSVTILHNVNNIYCVYPSKAIPVDSNFKFIDVRQFSQDASPKKDGLSEKTEPEEKKKLSLFKRFKEMYRNYWYVMLPVHLITSAFWFGGFYYLAKSGVDIAAILENWNVSEKLVKPFRDSSMGYVAVAYALYKIATPARYTVTLGGTTISINYLKKWGYIKPVPTKDELKEMYMERKENIMESVREKRDEFFQRTDKLRGKTDDIVENLEKKITSTASTIKDRRDNIVGDLEKSIQQTKQQLQEKKDNILEDFGGLKKAKDAKK